MQKSAWKHFEAIRKEAFEQIIDGNQGWLLYRIKVEKHEDMIKCLSWKADNPNYHVDPRVDASTHYFYKVLGELSFIDHNKFRATRGAPEVAAIYSKFEKARDIIDFVYRAAQWTWEECEEEEE